MKAEGSKILAIDTCVLRSASAKEVPVSKDCREVLLAIRRICHRLAWSKSLSKEYHDHVHGRFSRKWLASMYAKKKVVHVDIADSLAIPDSVQDATSHKECEALRKDLHLLATARSADGIIVTRDKAIQVIWSKCKRHFKFSKKIRWLSAVPREIEKL